MDIKAAIMKLLDHGEPMRSLVIVEELETRSFWFVRLRTYPALRSLVREGKLKSYVDYSVAAQRTCTFYRMHR